jgi:hypothetical protein
MSISPLAKTPKLPNSVLDDNGTSLIRCLFDSLTDISTVVNQLIKANEKLEDRVKALGG